VLLVGNGEASDGFSVPTTTEIWDPTTGDWAEVAALNKSRQAFALVPLSDDRALVLGGLNADSPPQSYSSAYIFDARVSDKGWMKTGTMLAARTSPIAAALPDGRVLVAGGYFHVQPDYSTAPRIDLAGYRGPLIDVDMGSAGAALATAEIFDPASGTWSGTGAMKYARTGAAAVTLADGRVLVVGSSGYSGSGYGFTVEVDPRAFGTAEIYDPATGRFTLAGELPDIDRAAIEEQGQPEANPMPEDDGESSGIGALVATPDGGAVLIGHTNYWKHLADLTRSFRFDSSQLTWSEIGNTWARVGEPTPVLLTTPGVRNLAGALVASVGDGSVLVAGGGGDSPNGGYTANDVAELYDAVTDTWTPLPAMLDRLRGGAAVSLPDGSVLLVGGIEDDGNEGGPSLTSATRFIP
jgi:N-acetylneuraminic acid mutarotase